jgi:hypothetical protein
MNFSKIMKWKSNDNYKLTQIENDILIILNLKKVEGNGSISNKIIQATSKNKRINI